MHKYYYLTILCFYRIIEKSKTYNFKYILYMRNVKIVMKRRKGVVNHDEHFQIQETAEGLH